MVTDPDVLAIGIDVGGTLIKGGVLTREGRCLAVRRLSTPAGVPAEGLCRRILDLIDDLKTEAKLRSGQVAGYGFSLAAFVTSDGTVVATAHLSQTLVGVNLRSILQPPLQGPLYFSLDTPAPTLGEGYFGAGRGVSHFAYVTVSTGIGAGSMIDGRYFTGGLGWAGGVGHIVIDERSDRVCEGCGNHGCLETMAASQGIRTTAYELAATHGGSRLAAAAARDPVGLTPADVARLALDGDSAAREVFHRAGSALGLGLVALADILSPERIVVGGGIALAGELLLSPARAVVKARAYPPIHRSVEIVPAALGDLSGVFGAAAMVFNDLHINPSRDGHDS